MRVVTFGEIMLRLSPPGFERFLQSPVFSATFGGGEANVAVSLAHFGADSRYVTCLPSHAIGDAAIRALRAEGVDVSAIVRCGDRIGIYFAETGASQRASAVIYDRGGSAISQIAGDAVDWRAVMASADWFHVTGITPALGARAAAATGDAIAAARQAGARVSVDLNYRAKLWTPERAQATMKPLVEGADIVMGNEEDLQKVLGISIKGDVARGEIETAAYRTAMEQVARECGARIVAVTLRESRSASDNGWSAVLWDRGSGAFHRSQRYDLRVVDRIGGGDGFAAGLIYGLGSGWPSERALRFAVAASAIKHTIPGDFNRASAKEVEALASGDSSGRVLR